MISIDSLQRREEARAGSKNGFEIRAARRAPRFFCPSLRLATLEMVGSWPRLRHHKDDVFRVVLAPLTALVAPDPHWDVKPLTYLNSVTVRRGLVRVKLAILARHNQGGGHDC